MGHMIRSFCLTGIPSNVTVSQGCRTTVLKLPDDVTVPNTSTPLCGSGANGLNTEENSPSFKEKILIILVINCHEWTSAISPCFSIASLDDRTLFQTVQAVASQDTEHLQNTDLKRTRHPPWRYSRPENRTRMQRLTEEGGRRRG